MKKLYILLIALFTLITLPGLQTQAYSLNANDIAIAELNGLTLNEIFLDGNLVVNSDFSNGTTGWIGSLGMDVNDGIATFLGTTQFTYKIQDVNFQGGNQKLYLVSYANLSNNSQEIYINDGIGQTTITALSYNQFIFYSGFRTTASNATRTRVSFQDNNSSNFQTFKVDYAYLYNLTSLGLTSLTQAQLDNYFSEWQLNNVYIEGYNQGELDGYAEGLEDNTAYVQGYNVGYTDGLLGGADMETGSSIIVLVLAALSFAFMLFGFTSKKRIFNLFAVGLFIVLGGLLFEYPAFIIVTIGFVIVNLYYTFVSD